MPNGEIVGIYICPVAGGAMQLVKEVEAIAGAGLRGDRYADGKGTWNKGGAGKRQVTLINGAFFHGSGFLWHECRRNIVTYGIELMRLIDREFAIGEARMRGVDYCYPCDRPSALSSNIRSFRDAFFDRGGLVAEVIKGGIIRTGDVIIRPPR